MALLLIKELTTDVSVVEPSLPWLHIYAYPVNTEFIFSLIQYNISGISGISICSWCLLKSSLTEAWQRSYISEHLGKNLYQQKFMYSII